MVSLLRNRVHHIGKPCRILYVSDFDEAGKNMPRQVARQMQYWINEYAADCDIRIEPIVMTEEGWDQGIAWRRGMTLQRIILTFKPGEIVIHALYRAQDGGLGPNTKARRRTVQALTREGLRQALTSLEGDVTMCGTSGFTTREDVLLTTTSPDAPETHKTSEGSMS